MAGFFSKFTNFDFSFGGSDSVIGIDIGASAIKVVELEEKRGKAVLKNYGELALGPYAGVSVGQATRLSDEQISNALADLLDEAEIESRTGALAIPLDSSLLSFIEVPTRDEGKLEEMIPFEARKYIPVPVSEVALDWWVLPERGEATQNKQQENQQEDASAEETSEVVISAIHNETLNKYQRIQDAVGLDIQFFEIEIFSIIRSVIGRDMSPLMILDIGAGTSKLAMVEYGIVKSYHIINKGSQDITLALARSLELDTAHAERIKREQGLQGEAAGQKIFEVAKAPINYIFSEAQSAIGNFEREHGRTINKVVLTGGGALLNGLHDQAREYFQTDVVLGNPFAKTEYPAFLEDTLKQAGPEFAVTIGVALQALQNS